MHVHNSDFSDVLFLIATILGVIAAFVPVIGDPPRVRGVHVGWLALAFVAAGLLYL